MGHGFKRVLPHPSFHDCFDWSCAFQAVALLDSDSHSKFGHNSQIAATSAHSLIKVLSLNVQACVTMAAHPSLYFVTLRFTEIPASHRLFRFGKLLPPRPCGPMLHAGSQVYELS